MLKQIWQLLVRWFQRFFGTSKRQNLTPPPVHQEPPPPLNDSDYEYLFMQLLEGVAHGWQQARVLKFFEALKERTSEAQWLGWLHRFGERLLATTSPNNELAARMVQLGEIGCGKIGELASEIGMQLLTRQDQTYPALEFFATPQLTYSEPIEDFETNLGGFDASSPDSNAQEAAEVKEFTLDELFLMLQQDPSLVQQIAEQLQIETTDPQVIIEALVNQFHGAS